MKIGKTIAVAAGVALISGSAIAGETITYSYDAQGRVVKVVKTGSVNNGTTVDYTHDKAGNRTRVRVTGAAQ